ncbi:MAG: MATE family efflux transporter, partial [Clostridia bacterium]
MENYANENELGTKPIGKLLFGLAVPAITAQIVNVLYNMVDRMYIGHIP